MIPDARRAELERHLLLELRNPQVPAPQRLMAPGVQEGLQQLFLEQADGLLQDLMQELADWQAGHRSLPSALVLQGLQRLIGLAQDRGLTGVQALANALLSALQSVCTGTGATTATDAVQAAEELARLLFLYAGGQQRSASADVLARLHA